MINVICYILQTDALVTKIFMRILRSWMIFALHTFLEGDIHFPLHLTSGFLRTCFGNQHCTDPGLLKKQINSPQILSTTLEHVPLLQLFI